MDGWTYRQVVDPPLHEFLIHMNLFTLLLQPPGMDADYRTAGAWTFASLLADPVGKAHLSTGGCEYSHEPLRGGCDE